MDNKLIECKQNWITKLFLKIRNMLFSRKTSKKVTESNIINKDENKEKIKKDKGFKNSIKSELQYKTDADIEILRNRFEENIIKEEDLTTDEIKELTKYYGKLTKRVSNF